MDLVEWDPVAREPERLGLRERKKHALRRRLTSTATVMFLERGFDAVRVTEIAAACGVSEKTVFNHFPVKEALLLDRLAASLRELETALADPGRTPTEAVLRVLDNELDGLTGWLAAQDDPDAARDGVRKFRTLATSTASLRAYQAEMAGRLRDVALAAVARRTGRSVDDPEPLLLAIALAGLWDVHARALDRHLDDGLPMADVGNRVRDEVRRAARLIDVASAQA